MVPSGAFGKSENFLRRFHHMGAFLVQVAGNGILVGRVLIHLGSFVISALLGGFCLGCSNGVDVISSGNSDVDTDTDTDNEIGSCNPVTHETDKGMIGSVGTAEWAAKLSSADVGMSVLAYWKYGKQTTLTITFDDSTQGQTHYVLPKLKELGIIGTFFVNPGTSTFATDSAIWHAAYATYGQEIANHTSEHEGGDTEPAAQRAVDLASEYIKEHIYGLSPKANKILAFNNGGAAGWHVDTTSEEWNMFIRGNYLFERKHSSGISPGTSFEEMRSHVLSAFQSGGQFETTGGSMHFHGICDEETYPDCDNESVEFPTNNGAVQKVHLYDFFQWLVDPGEFSAQSIWLAGYAEYRKYMVVRSGTTASLEGIEGSGDNTVINVRLGFNMPSPIDVEPVQYTTTYGFTWGDNNEMADSALYICDPITVFTKTPVNWTAARVTQATGESHVYRVDNDEVRYEAFTNSIVRIEHADESEVDIHYVGIDP
ncbi:MAG: polysaccharide deacetylase family protein [Deltaproteobacteria bacterium]|nr:polysaccharide deacetylase family protein [Deltaproteobacteria bacterium]